MKTYFVYMLLCADGSFYVGITNNVDMRLAQHQLGIDKRCYTFTRRPVKLVHSSYFYDVFEAIAWEKQLKGWRRSKKEALIQNDWPGIVELSNRRSAHSAEFLARKHGQSESIVTLRQAQGDDADGQSEEYGHPSTGSG